MVLNITINPDLCNKCGICAQICRRIAQKNANFIPEVVDEESCISCGHCVAICPQGAISHIDFPQGSITSINRKAVPSYEQVLEMVRARRSRRVFMDKPVEKEVIGKIIGGARFAPSADNVQSTEFIVVQDKAVLERIVRLTADWLAKITRQLQNPVIRTFVLIFGGREVRREVRGAIHGLDDFDRIVNDVRNGRDTILHGAPALILFHADRGASFAAVNANLALQNATFIAEALGLGSFYTGYVVAACDHDNSIPKLLSLPNNHKIYGGLALGYPKFKFQNWIERKTPEIRWL